jgi:hypothetical protein
VIFIRYRKLDQNGDYTFGKGQQCLTYGTYAVSQAIQTKMKLLKGEWFEDIEEGLPLFQQILRVQPTDSNLTIIDSLIKSRILGTTDVAGIESFSSDYDSSERRYSYSAVVDTKYGAITVSNTL